MLQGINAPARRQTHASHTCRARHHCRSHQTAHGHGTTPTSIQPEAEVPPLPVQSNCDRIDVTKSVKSPNPAVINEAACGTCTPHAHEKLHGCGHQHNAENTIKVKPFLERLADHSLIRSLQATTGILMIPLTPLMIYALVKSVKPIMPSTLSGN